MSEVKIYHQNPVSLDLVEETFKASFNIDFDKDYWKWRFLNNPNSDKTYIAYILEDGVLAAYYAVSPMKVVLNGQEKSIALSNMTMTHPNYRGRGYFKKLAIALFEDLKNDGFVGVFGFANHNSHYGFRKYLNWKDLSALNSFSVKPEHFRHIKIDENLVSLNVESISEEVLESIKHLEVSNENLTRIKRDIDNIRWRLKTNPSHTYKVQIGKQNNEIVSLLFYKNYGEEIDVMEFFYSPKVNNTDLLNCHISNLIKTTNSTINMWSNLMTDEHINLEKQGFQESSFNTYFGVIPLVQDDSLLDYKNWHYRFIDSDIY